MTQKTEDLIKQKRQQYIEKFQDSLAKSPKFFRFYQRHILRNRISPSANTYDNVITTTSQKKALQRILCCCFSSDILFLKHRPKHDIKNMEIISDIQISELEVKNFLINLDTTNACRPDGIPTRLLKECSREIFSSPCRLFNMSLSTGRCLWNRNVRMLCSSTRKTRVNP